MCKHDRSFRFNTFLVTYLQYDFTCNLLDIFRVDIKLYQHEWKLGKREIVWKHDTRRVECFHRISSFSNFHECWYNCIPTRKNVLYFFYNIAQRNIKYNISLLILTSGGKFSVLTLSYINTALSQSAFRVYKCYILYIYIYIIYIYITTMI